MIPVLSTVFQIFTPLLTCLTLYLCALHILCLLDVSIHTCAVHQITLYLCPSPGHPTTNDFFSAYDVRKECHKGSETLMDVVNNFHWCNLLPRSAVLSAHSTTAISGDRMCGDTDHTVLAPPIIRIPMHCTAGYDSPIPLKSFPRASTWAIRDYTSRLE